MIVIGLGIKIELGPRVGKPREYPRLGDRSDERSGK